MVKSFATAKTDYVAVQIRVNGDCCSTVKVQGRGDKVNRGYGVTGDFTVKSEFGSWLGDLPHELKSLAGTGQRYVAAQVAIRGESLHFQVAAANGFNRSYGAVVEVASADFPELATFVTAGEKVIYEGDSDTGCCDGCCHS